MPVAQVWRKDLVSGIVLFWQLDTVARPGGASKYAHTQAYATRAHLPTSTPSLVRYARPGWSVRLLGASRKAWLDSGHTSKLMLAARAAATAAGNMNAL